MKLQTFEIELSVKDNNTRIELFTTCVRIEDVRNEGIAVRRAINEVEDSLRRHWLESTYTHLILDLGVTGKQGWFGRMVKEGVLSYPHDKVVEWKGSELICWREK